MSDYVPDAIRRVHSEVEATNSAAFVAGSSGPVNVNISGGRVNLISGDNVVIDGGDTDQRSPPDAQNSSSDGSIEQQFPVDPGADTSEVAIDGGDTHQRSRPESQNSNSDGSTEQDFPADPGADTSKEQIDSREAKEEGGQEARTPNSSGEIQRDQTAYPGSAIVGELKAKVIYDYDAAEDDELTIRVGDVIGEVDEYEGWSEGLLNGKEVFFPEIMLRDVTNRASPHDHMPAVCNIATLVDGNPAAILINKAYIVSGNNTQITDKTEKNVFQQHQTADVDSEMQIGFAKTGSSYNIQDLTSKIETINKHSWKTTSVKILEDCHDEKLNEPDFQVYPQMREVEDYYKGGYVKVEPGIVLEEKTKGFQKFFQNPQVTIVRNECINERGFNVCDTTAKENSVTIDSLLESIMKDNKLKIDEKLDLVAVVASAGSGKTTLLRRLARQILMKNGITEENGFSSSNQSRFNMVNYIELKNVQDAESISVAEFLFGGMFKDKNDVEDAYEWLLKNQSKAVLFLDGYDQMTAKIEKKNRVIIKPHQKASPATIMHNLLSRNLLPHLQIVISSREFAISELQGGSRPKCVVTLTGLSQVDAKKLFIAFIGQNGTRSWKKLSTSSRGLLHFISIPVFLILTAIVMSRDSDSPPPHTVTGLFARIVQILPCTENIREREKIIEILNKLKKMAHEGMLQGRVTFYENDLKKHGLSIDDVRDLLIKVPGKNILSRYLLERHNYVLFFFHQSFQEFLSACFISEMDLGEFRIFNHQNLHEKRWSVVRRFSCGLIHDENLSLREDFHQIPDKKTKQQILRKSLASRLKKAVGYQVLDLYAAVYESNNYDLVDSTVRQISLRHTPLGPDGTHTLSCIMTRCGNLDHVDVFGCGIDSKLLAIMAENMKGYKVHVKTFLISLVDFTIAGINSLLENLIVGTLETEIARDAKVGHAALNWENIREVKVGYKFGDVVMTKMSNSIEIYTSSNKFKGTLNMQDNVLRIQTFDDHGTVERLLSDLPHIEKLLKPSSVKVVLKDGIAQQYLKYAQGKHLRSIRDWKFEGKIENILLDCYFKSSKVYPSLIASTVRFLQAEVFDTALEYKILDVTQVSELQAEFSNYACELNIHWCYQLHFLESLPQLTRSLSLNPVRNLRLYIWCKCLLKDLETFVEKCKVKNLSMIFIPKYEISKSDKRKLMHIAAISKIDLEFRKSCKKRDDVKGAWERLDWCYFFDEIFIR